MALDLVVYGSAVPDALVERLGKATFARCVDKQAPQAWRLRGAHRHPAVAAWCAAESVDFAYIESGRHLADYALLAMDMDSTLVTIECIDEVADFAGKKQEVAEITAAAMRGELDFAASLRRRVALLAGLPETVLASVYTERLRLSPGALELLAAARRAGLKTLLVSGGFTYFTERLKDQLALDHAAANVLEIEAGILTGRVVGEIVDADGKARHVAHQRDRLGVAKSQVITIGDGANDILMMAESGLSVAFHAKPVAQANATVAINHAGLDALLTILDT